jgi:hypothetical protein
MNKFTKMALVAVALAAAPTMAFSQSVSFNLGNVAIGYNDGYWDRAHNWHAWERAEHRDAYRAEKSAEYHEWKHDRDRDMGWHERHY